MRSTALTLVLALACTMAAHAQEDSPSPEESRNDKLLEALARIRLSGYVHAQYLDHQSESRSDEFSVRRGRLKLTYKASELSRLVVAVDASSSGTELKDAYIELVEPWSGAGHTLTAGQFNWPFGFEIGYSSSSREVPERSRVVRALFPGERDRGVMVSGSELAGGFEYRLALVNGSGTRESSLDDSHQDLVGSVGWDFGPARAGASFYEGSARFASESNPAGEDFDRTRYGFDVQAETPIPGFSVRGEYIAGEEHGRDVEGWYGYLIQQIGKRHRLALRFDEYDADRDVQDNAVLTATLGYTFFWDSNTLLMLGVEEPRREAEDQDDRVVTARVQYRF